MPVGMRTLMHAPFDPGSRAIRLTLEEKKLPCRLVPLDLQTMDQDEHATLAAANPAMTLPVLLDETPMGEDAAISPASAAIEYLDELQPDPSLFPKTAAGRAETRRLIAWFELKFASEVGSDIGVAAPRHNPRRQEALQALAWHLDYTDWLLERRGWLAGDRMTADGQERAGDRPAG